MPRMLPHMKRSVLLLPLLLAACADPGRPLDPVGQQDYSAIGYEPFWSLAIGADAIALTRGPGVNEAGNAVRTIRYPRVLPRMNGDVRIWQSGSGTAVITVEARRAESPCEAGGRLFEDRVRMRLSGVELNGCGGRMLAETRR